MHIGTDLSPTYGNSMRALASVDVGGEEGDASRDMNWLSQPHGTDPDNLGGSEGGDTTSHHLQHARGR